MILKRKCISVLKQLSGYTLVWEDVRYTLCTELKTLNFWHWFLNVNKTSESKRQKKMNYLKSSYTILVKRVIISQKSRF